MQRAVTEHAKDRRRSSLLKAALDEFFHQGFKRARMEDIARGAGLSRGTLYLYFTSKQALFMALFEEVAITVSTVSKQAMGAASAPQALQQLMQSIPQTYSHCPLPKLVKVLISDARGAPQLVGFYQEQVIGRVFTLLENILHRGVASGEWHCQDVALTTRLSGGGACPVFGYLACHI
ncbi:MAG: AcrR family transcriptional regulator [Paraglaciecola sp.]|jgi:AcrR family transcriptional regulator